MHVLDPFQLSLYNLTQFKEPQARGPRSYAVGQKVQARKEIEADIKRLCIVTQRSGDQISWTELHRHLQEASPTLFAAFQALPPDLEEVLAEQEGWWVVGQRAQQIERPGEAKDVFRFWRDGRDLDARRRLFDMYQAELAEASAWREQARKPEDPLAELGNRFEALAVDDEYSSGTEDLLDDPEDDAHEVAGGPGSAGPAPVSSPNLPNVSEPALMLPPDTWQEPATDRPTQSLLLCDDPWSFSRTERVRLVEHFAAEIVAAEAPALRHLRANLTRVNEEIRALNDDDKLAVLRRARVIGATTNGCANVLDLIRKVKPTVLLVEEAGECLESQIVANLVPSVQHLICIGDHLQLRPHITSFSLSIDSTRGKIHRHDVSLFERLAELPIDMSVLNTQRRMRPQVSNLIRNALYPELEDAPNVHTYPDVKGMQRNVFFVDHNLRQDATSALHSSQTNTQEARWVVDLVRHLALQGSGASICILTPYLGQVKVLRRLLDEVSITTILDDRDLGDIEAAEDPAEVVDEEGAETIVSAPVRPTVARQQSLNACVTLRTIDRFQGEEADVVVLSLVRNTGARVQEDDEEEEVTFSRAARASIGFLKSPNRTNVAVSRVRHGLFLFGDAGLLRARASIWESIIRDLEGDGAVGPMLPARCPGHPDDVLDITAPGQLRVRAPFGGCLKPCSCTLPCGHRCPQACHPIDNEVSDSLITQSIHRSP